MSRTSRVHVESLDARRLLSAALSGSLVYVTGTPDRDHVFIQVDGNDTSKLLVNVNGDQQSFDLGAITGVVVELGAGADHSIVSQNADSIHLPVTMFGGGGADLLIGGSGDDALFGGGGHDRIIGGGGNDLISGGGSRDQLAGGDGNDTILGGNGDDAIEGGAGDDSLAGGLGDDYADGGDGSDLIAGGADFDSLIGGAGSDSLAGGAGDDDLAGGSGDNTSTGGGGSDAFAKDGSGTNNILDKTSGADREYTPVGLDFVPQSLHTLFNETFPNSVPVGVRVNDDHTFIMLYQYQGDGSTYHAYFTFTGNHPFAQADQPHGGVELIKYEVAPNNIPPQTAAAFHHAHPDAVIKELYVDHDGQNSFAMVRVLDGGGESHWVQADWLD
jgi:Ca2+-binding RTX toxin-like protein